MAPKRKAPTGEAATSGAVDMKGKKAATAATSAATTDLKKGDGDWVKSTLKEPALTKLYQNDFVPPVDQLTVPKGGTPRASRE